MNRKSCIQKIRLPLAGLAGLVSVAAAHGGNSKVFEPYFAWYNSFNDPNARTNISFGSSSNSQWTAWWSDTGTNHHGFPASIRGWHSGWNPAKDNLFPRQIAKTTSIPCSFSYDCGGTLSGAFAFDCFFRWDNAKSSPELEVMVWSRNNSQPLGQPLAGGLITENGIKYDLWGGYNASGCYTYTFLPHRSFEPASLPTGSGSVDIDLIHFLSKLPGQNGYGYNEWMYLDAVEAGFEVVSGDGWASGTWFSCTAY